MRACHYKLAPIVAERQAGYNVSIPYLTAKLTEVHCRQKKASTSRSSILLLWLSASALLSKGHRIGLTNFRSNGKLLSDRIRS